MGKLQVLWNYYPNFQNYPNSSHLKNTKRKSIMVYFQRDFHIWMNNYANLNENDALATWTKWNSKLIAKIETIQQIADEYQVSF